MKLLSNIYTIFEIINCSCKLDIFKYVILGISAKYLVRWDSEAGTFIYNVWMFPNIAVLIWNL